MHKLCNPCILIHRHSSVSYTHLKYPEKKEGDKYAAIASYLKKAAAAKADKHNQLDRVVSFNGASYNSDCLIVGMDKCV